jgi:hypothetical protein
MSPGEEVPHEGLGKTFGLVKTTGCNQSPCYSVRGDRENNVFLFIGWGGKKCRIWLPLSHCESSLSGCPLDGSRKHPISIDYRTRPPYSLDRNSNRVYNQTHHLNRRRNFLSILTLLCL